MDITNCTAYLAAENFEKELEEELGGVDQSYGRLLLKENGPKFASWAQNIWFEPQLIEIQSISEAVKHLKSLQRNWCNYSYDFFRRSELIQAQLPKVSSKPLLFPSKPPQSPLGSWMLLTPDQLLYSQRGQSLLPNGEVKFVEDKSVPSRAYLKLWDLFSIWAEPPQKGALCLDLGSSPGGWTWVLSKLGCQIKSVDKAELDPRVLAMPGVEYIQSSAFALKPEQIGQVDWLFSDIICYPERLLELVKLWHKSGLVSNFVCTIKFQGETDHGIVKKFLEIPDSRAVHLFNNKHELMWFKIKKLNGADDPD